MISWRRDQDSFREVRDNAVSLSLSLSLESKKNRFSSTRALLRQKHQSPSLQSLKGQEAWAIHTLWCGCECQTQGVACACRGPAPSWARTSCCQCRRCWRDEDQQSWTRSKQEIETRKWREERKKEPTKNRRPRKARQLRYLLGSLCAELSNHRLKVECRETILHLGFCFFVHWKEGEKGKARNLVTRNRTSKIDQWIKKSKARSES